MIRRLSVWSLLLALVGSLVFVAPAYAVNRVVHDFRLRHVTVDGVVKLLATAHIAASDGGGNSVAECAEKVPVRVQRRGGGRWKTIKKTRTSSTARVRTRFADRAGRYRLLLPAHTTANNTECFKAISETKRHTH